MRAYDSKKNKVNENKPNDGDPKSVFLTWVLNILTHLAFKSFLWFLEVDVVLSSDEERHGFEANSLAKSKLVKLFVFGNKYTC